MDTERRNLSAFLRIMWIAAALVTLALGLLNLTFGELNQDEGWYLYAAREVAHGKLPYIDFASTQGPVLPFTYGALWPLYGRFGVAGGRTLTWGLGLLTALAAARLASRLTPDATRRGAAALAAFILIGVNVYHSYFTTVVKTYSLGGLLTMLGFLSLAGRRVMLSGILLALATATRASLGVTLPVVFLGLLYSAWCAPTAARASRPSLVSRCYPPFGFALGAGITLLTVFVPLAIRAPEGVWFALVEYHAGREAGSLAYKGGFISRVVGAYFVPMAVLTALLVARGKQLVAKGNREPTGQRALIVAGWVSVGAVTLVHIMAPFPYDDYQAVIFPLFAALLAAALYVSPTPRGLSPARTTGLLLLLCTAAAFSSPLNQQWFTGKRDRIWWPLREKPSLTLLQETGRTIRSLAGEGATLLTQDPYLAVEADLEVPPGMALGPFCYFPDWPRDKAEACRVMNRDMMQELLRTTTAPVAAFSGYGFAIASPAVKPLPEAERTALWDLLEARYAPVAAIPRFGQAETELKVYRLREGEDLEE